jgi:hypothetical protein
MNDMKMEKERKRRRRVRGMLGGRKGTREAGEIKNAGSEGMDVINGWRERKGSRRDRGM